MIEDLKPLLESDQLTFTAMADGTAVLLDLDGHQVLSLNTTGALIVRELYAGAANAHDLAAHVMKAFDIDQATAERDVAEFLTQLRALLSQQGG